MSNTKTTTVRARMKPDIKKRAEQILKTLGLTPSEAINVFYHKIVTEQGIPFSLHIPNEETQTAIHEVRDNKKASGASLKDWKRNYSEK